MTSFFATLRECEWEWILAERMVTYNTVTAWVWVVDIWALDFARLACITRFVAILAERGC